MKKGENVPNIKAYWSLLNTVNCFTCDVMNIRRKHVTIFVVGIFNCQRVKCHRTMKNAVLSLVSKPPAKVLK